MEKTITIQQTTPDFGTKEWFFKKIDDFESLDIFKEEQADSLAKAFPNCMTVFDFSGMDLAEESVILAGIIATGKEEAREWITWFTSELDFGKNVVDSQKSNCTIQEKDYLVKDKESLWKVLQTL